MASGLDRHTFKPLSGFAYTLQCLQVTAETQIGTRIMREYFGSLNPQLLVRENFSESALDRWIYALLYAWELWVPMWDTKSWEYVSQGDERSGGFGLVFKGEHFEHAHLGDYSSPEQRQLRAIISSNAARTAAAVNLSEFRV